ncbi:MAG: hypothetical protein FWD66_02000 [Paludibacter sp.]|nr:hypothetical protein [Paludibacter sp.]
MKKNKLFSAIAAVVLLLSNGAFLSAQVTVGSDKVPETYSLLELVSNHSNGLRLPQMTTAQRDAMTNTADFKTNPNAQGLTIFNTTTYCVETWNGNTWISQCMDCSKVVFPVLQSSYTLCTGATFSDLTASVGGNERWYNDPSGGAARDNVDPLVSGKTYYAEEFVGSCINPTRYPVTVTLGSCSTPPTGGNLTTFTNVMYDFQHQTLLAYNSSGMPTTYRWQFSENNSVFNDITDVPNSNFYTVPAHFADSYANAGTTGLYFRCILSNPKGSTTTNTLNILFINTSSSGYAYDVINGDTVRYLTIQTTNTNFPSGTMKIALTSLGASENNDAGDLGDFYQWGRVKDGHEHIVWNKDANYINTIEPTGNGATSIAIPGPAPAADLDANGQIKPTSTTFLGNFITVSSGYWDNGNNNLWGNGVTATRPAPGSDIPLSSPPPSTSSWTYQVNNPCPDNWSVPSSWNFWDICTGTGTDVFSVTDGTNYDGTVNNWAWRTTTTNAIGGAIITNADGEKVFLPAAGYRNYTNASLNSVGTYGYYWSSSVITVAFTNTHACYLRFYSSFVYPGYNSNNRALGFSVRCVAP